MLSRIARPLAFVCVILLGTSCEEDPSSPPTNDEVVNLASGLSALSAALNLSATAISDTEISLAWQDNATNETGFEVYRSTTGSSGPFHRLATIAANVTGYRDIGLTAAQLYCYKVRAFKQAARKTTYTTFSSTACRACIEEVDWESPCFPPLPATP